MKEYIFAWDVAKKQDATVFQLYRRTPDVVRGNGFRPDSVFNYLDLVHQKKIEGVPYTRQCEAAKELIDTKGLKNNTDLVVDCTGVGEAVVDIMRDNGLDPVPILFTGGNQMRVIYKDDGRRFGFGSGSFSMKRIQEFSVPKVDMIHAAKVAVEQNRIRIVPGIPYRDEFLKELMHFKGKVNENGTMVYGNDNEVKHDDFVACFLMACWFAKYSGQTRNERTIRDDEKADWDPLGDYGW